MTEDRKILGLMLFSPNFSDRSVTRWMGVKLNL